MKNRASYRRRWDLLVQLILVLLMGSMPVTAESENPLTVNCFPGWGGRYRPLDWTPLEITVASQLSEPFAGVLHVSCAQDSYNQLLVSHPVVVTPGVPTTLSLSTRIDFNADVIDLRLTDQKGRTQLRQELGLWDFSNEQQLLVPVNQEDLFIGVVGRRGLGLMRLQKKAVSICHWAGQTRRGKVVIEEKRPRMVPWDWSGFDSLDLLVLYDPDWSQLRPEQLTAVCDWVRQGGRVLIVLGRGAFPVHSDLGRQLPVTIGDLEEVVPSDTWLTQRGLTLMPGRTVTGYRLEPRVGVTLLNSVPPASPLLEAVSQVGFGRLGVLGLDPAALTGDPDRLWEVVLEPLLRQSVTGDTERTRRRPYSQDVLGVGQPLQRSLVVEDSDPNAADQGAKPTQRYYELFNQQDGQRQVLDYLYGIEELRPMSIGWVVLLLVLLALLLGPVDYWVLKKLDRQPLTWITSLGWIVLFTVGAYYGVQVLRAGDLQLRTVSVVDAVQDQPQACATYLSGIFAPKSADYRLEQMQPGQWFCAVSPEQAMMRRYPRSHPQRSIACIQQNGNNWISSLPINIWTMQSFEMETLMESPGLQATVTLQGRRVMLSLDNRTDRRILRGCLLLSDGRGLGFGTVEAGRRLDLDQPSGALIGWSGAARDCQGQQSLALNRIFAIDKVRTRSQAIETYLEQGAAVVCVQLDEGPTPYQVVQPSCKTHHLRFVRLVVFPQISEERKDD